MERESGDYQAFLDRAFEKPFYQNFAFREALRESRQTILRHTLGIRDPTKTTLTEREFVLRLNFLHQIAFKGSWLDQCRNRCTSSCDAEKYGFRKLQSVFDVDIEQCPHSKFDCQLPKNM